MVQASNVLQLLACDTEFVQNIVKYNKSQEEEQIKEYFQIN